MKLFRLLFFFILLGSCTKKMFHHSSNDIFSIGGVCSISNEKGSDSQTGSITCGDIHLEYDYGRYSSPGPLTDSEKFALAFQGNYYVKFFEKIYIDPKLGRYFIDSVEILSVEALPKNGSLLFDCKTCNMVAILRFRNNIYPYPWVNDLSQNERLHYDFYIDTIENQYRKIYIDKTGKQPSGLFLEPIENKRQSNKLAVFTNQHFDKNKILPLLQSVRINKIK